MPEDRVTISADASQYFDVLGRAGAAGDRFSRTGDRLGEGFVRGERVVRTATANITAGLLSSSNAATTTLIALQGLERVFRIGVLPTVAIAGAVAVFEVLHRQIQRTEKASSDLGKELGKSFGLQIQKGSEGISADIDALIEKMAALRKETKSTTSAILDFFKRGTPGGPRGSFGDPGSGAPRPAATTGPSEEAMRLIAAEQRLRELARARADKEVELAEAKRDENKLAQLQLDYESKRAKLFENAFRAGLSQADLMKRLIALQIGLNAEVAKEGKARSEAAAAAGSKLAGTTRGFFKDIGSGQFAKDFQQKQKEAKDEQRGRELFEQIKAGQGRGFFKDPLSQAELREADRIGKAAGVEDISRLDFSNLDQLSKYDFTGLKILDGIKISIQ